MADQTSGFFIKRESGDILWFDAITALSEQYSASVTKHPMSSGASYTDHTTVDNLKFSMSGVLSDADFNISRPLLNDTNVSINKQFTNNTRVVEPVKITSPSSINRILPEVIAQFTRDSIPEAYVTPQPKAKLAAAVKADLITILTGREAFAFVEYVGDIVVKSYPNCILTSLSFSEDTNSGEGLFPVMQFEQVKFTEVKSIKVRINKGRKTGSSKKVPTEKSPANAPSTYTEKSSYDYQGKASQQ
ncbi:MULTISPECIES: phage baseplate protein [unclassified Pseudomonas]|uniref:phage baseplate protein n=1 Tax=unclassified Pseudomonas TaxID=196821 RepID=UPI0039B76CD1